MKMVFKNLVTGLIIFLSLFSCKTTQLEYASGKFVVIESTVSDSFKGLAVKYLDDPDKDWLISEFNGIHALRPGDNIVIPLTYFNIGGFKSTGYQIVPVFNYQVINNSSELSKRNYFTEIQLKSQFQFLRDNNIRVIAASELLQFLEYKIQIPEKSVVLTFTGQSKAFYETAYPVIAAFGYDATLFIDPERAGQDGEVSWAILNELSSGGINIQSCAGASDLTIDGFNGTFKDYFFFIEKKIALSKQLIEKQLGKRCTFYAYPGGKSNHLIINFLEKHGFEGAFINSGDGNPFFVDNFEINRVNINYTTSIDEYKSKIITFQHLELN